MTSKIPFDGLRVMIPETIGCFDQTNYLLYVDEEGYLQRRQDASYTDFEAMSFKSI